MSAISKTECPPLVSIIIPTYNNAAVVCDAIECSLNQTYANLEVIVVDDGSTDDTKEMVDRKYSDRIIYLHQTNKGTGSARNTGIRHASGKYLQLLDADDLLDHDKISIQMEQLLNVSGKALSYCDYACCYLNDLSKTIESLRPVLQNENPFYDIILKWETEISIPIHCFIFDADLFKQTGIAFDETLHANEDWECWLNVFALNPKVIFVDRVLAYYRVRMDSRCRDRVQMRNSHLMAIKKQIRKHRSNKEIVEKLNQRKTRIKHLYRDVCPVTRFMEKSHPVVKKLYFETIPLRIQRFFY